MIKISHAQKKELEAAGLIRYRKVKNGIEIQNSNLYVANREHLSRSKSYYVVEEAKIMKFLGLWKDTNYKNKPKNKNHKKNNYTGHNNYNKKDWKKNDK